MLNKIFGKREKAPTTNESIQRMNDNLDTIEKRQDVLRKKIDIELTKAREASNKKNKNLAMQHLKRKKQYEEQLEKLTQQRENTEQLQMKLEEATMNLEIIQTQSAGANAIKHVYAANKMSVERIDQEIDKVREVMEQANEVSQAISQPFGGYDIDEDELLAELDQIEQEETDKRLLDIGTIPGPVKTDVKVQPSKVTVAESEEDKLLAELEAQFA